MHIKLFEKFKTYDYIALVVMLICIFMSIIFLVRAALSKTVNVEVTTIPKISYKVHLKNNDYYETNELGQGMKYVASLIDYIDTDVYYSIKSSSLMDYDYSYYIDATARVYGDNSKLSVLYEKNKVLIEEKKITDNGKDNVDIHEKFNIDYEEYNKLISSFKTSYNISSVSDVSVVLHVNAKAKANGMDKEANRHVRAGSPEGSGVVGKADTHPLSGGRLIETVGDGGPRLMIEHDRTRLTDPSYFF